MRKLWPLLAVALGALALAALVGIVRRDSLVSTPGHVVEEFLQRIADDRYEKAAGLLADGAAGGDASAALKEWKREVESGLGKVRGVRGETKWISGEDAEARGILVAGKRERRLRFSLRRDRGSWRIARLDEFWGGSDARPATGPIRAREAWRGGRRPTRLSSRHP